jgi:uncharacterized membrane protein YdjX (TVP38/TMEM64 family)
MFASVRSSHSLILSLIFLCFLVSFTLLYSSLPPFSASEAAAIRIPQELSELGPISRALSSYRDANYYHVLGIFSFLYVFLQAFAIPGTIFLSVLAGPLFGSSLGLLVVSAVATSGSCLCYLLVSLFGRDLVKAKIPSVLDKVQTKLRLHWHNLFFYLLFLRISPLLPNVSISVCSPIIGVPLKTFAAATFIGLMPANYLHLQTGIQLNQLTGADENAKDTNATRNNLTRMAALLAVACLALLPTLFRGKLESFDETLSMKASQQGENKQTAQQNKEEIQEEVANSLGKTQAKLRNSMTSRQTKKSPVNEKKSRTSSRGKRSKKTE